MHFFDADRLSGRDLAEIDFLASDADAPQRVTTMVLSGKDKDVRQCRVGTRGRLVDFRRTFHFQSFVGALLVEDPDKFVRTGLFLEKIGDR